MHQVICGILHGFNFRCCIHQVTFVLTGHCIAFQGCTYCTILQFKGVYIVSNCIHCTILHFKGVHIVSNCISRVYTVHIVQNCSNLHVHCSSCNCNAQGPQLQCAGSDLTMTRETMRVSGAVKAQTRVDDFWPNCVAKTHTVG